MSFNIGFNFRKTSTFVTDGANETYVLPTDIYPITRNGVTFGWTAILTSGGDGLDRSAALDRRLAGVHYNLSPGINTFQVDLPAASDYRLELAVGDTAAHGPVQWDIRDTSTSLISSSQSITANTAWDATTTNYTHANWPASETAVQKTFATSTLNYVMDSGATASLVQHLFVSQVAAAGVTPQLPWLPRHTALQGEKGAQNLNSGFIPPR